MSKAPDTIPGPFAKRVLELRKQRDWSQGDLAKKIGTSAAIVGRYERGEMTPSIDVARNIANAFGVTLDYLLADNLLPDVLRDKEMLQRWTALDALVPEERQRILFVVDGLIRDANARHAYAKTG
jgi:transcriptional regulator with XRE-family HTH domain